MGGAHTRCVNMSSIHEFHMAMSPTRNGNTVLQHFERGNASKYTTEYCYCHILSSFTLDHNLQVLWPFCIAKIDNFYQTAKTLMSAMLWQPSNPWWDYGTFKNDTCGLDEHWVHPSRALCSKNSTSHCVKIKQPCMYMWQHHCRSSRLWVAWKSTKELAASEAIMNIEYWLHLWRPLSTIAFSTALGLIACVGRHDPSGPRRPSFGMKYNVALNRRREWGLAVNRVKSRAFKMAVFQYIAQVIFAPYIYTILIHHCQIFMSFILLSAKPTKVFYHWTFPNLQYF